MLVLLSENTGKARARDTNCKTFNVYGVTTIQFSGFPFASFSEGKVVSARIRRPCVNNNTYISEQANERKPDYVYNSRILFHITLVRILGLELATIAYSKEFRSIHCCGFQSMDQYTTNRWPRGGCEQ